MSRANIESMNPQEFSVTFATRRGDGITYFYSPSDFASIVAGSDPADFVGTQGEPGTKSWLEVAIDFAADAFE